MKMLQLTNSERPILLDDSYYDLAASYSNWHLTKQGYVRSNKGGGSQGRTKQIFLHELILGPCPKGLECDHRDLNRSNYQRENLWYILRSYNQRHKTHQKNNTSGYRGVVWHSKGKLWQAKIKVNGVVKSLGYFHDAALAGKAYDEAARQYHGEFATLNFKEN